MSEAGSLASASRPGTSLMKIRRRARSASATAAAATSALVLWGWSASSSATGETTGRKPSARAFLMSLAFTKRMSPT